tara:strand:- start:5043 stop:6194 length:1152 start_codon:yes stop_codon:yes gene_type:complete
MINSFKNIPKKTSSIGCLDSGGLDSAYMICKLVERGVRDIHVLTLDIGQEDCDAIIFAPKIEQKLIRHRIDVKDIFCESYVLPLLHANGVYSNQHPLSASLSRPLIALTLVNLAKEYNLEIILHAATPSQNSMRRFNGAIKDLGYKGAYGSPYTHDHVSRSEKSKYVESCGAIVPKQRNFSIDSNIFCREFESGNLNNAESVYPPDEMFVWTKERNQPDQEITIQFQKGRPTSINGNDYELSGLITELNQVAGSYGLGRYRGLEENPFGEKVIEVREAPAAFVLLQAYQYLLNATQTQSTLVAKSQLEQLWTREASEGRWFGPLKQAIDSFNQSLMSEISGSVSFELSSRSCAFVGVKATTALYTTDREYNEHKHLQKIKIAA